MLRRLNVQQRQASDQTDVGCPREGEVAAHGLAIWVQVRDLAAEHERLSAAGAHVLREPRQEPWGLHEMWVEDPDGVRLVLVQVPADHPLRRDQR